MPAAGLHLRPASLNTSRSRRRRARPRTARRRRRSLVRILPARVEFSRASIDRYQLSLGGTLARFWKQMQTIHNDAGDRGVASSQAKLAADELRRDDCRRLG